MSPLIKYSFYTILAGAVFLTGKELLFSRHNPAVINPANYSQNIFDLSKGEFKMAENNLHTNQESNWDKTKEVSGDAWDATKEGAAKAGDAISKKSSDAWEATKDVSGKAWDKTKEVSGDAWDATKEGAAKAKDAITH